MPDVKVKQQILEMSETPRADMAGNQSADPQMLPTDASV